MQGTNIIGTRRCELFRCAAVLLALAFLLLSPCRGTPALAQTSSGTDVLGNADVVKMVGAGLADSLVIAKIRTSQCKFDTSLDAILKLKEAGVSDAVVQAMVEAAPASPSEAAEAPADPNDPKSRHPAGIYWLDQDGDKRQMVQLEPTVYSAGKSGGYLASAMTYGVAKVKWKAVVRSPVGTLRVTDSTPEFWFYFEQTEHGLSYSGTFFGGASSPNEFILARMDRKKDSRELVVSEGNTFGFSVGTRPEDTVPIEFTKVAPGVYRVWPAHALPPGEYCFFYAGTSMGMGMTGGKLFDFGVDSQIQKVK